MNNELTEILDKLDLETFLDAEGIDYKRSYGSSGAQLNLRECPACGNEKWKLYLNAKSALGHCHRCEEGFNFFKLVKMSTGLSGRALNDYIKNLGLSVGWRPPRKSLVLNNAVSDLVLPPSIDLPFHGRNLKYLTNRNVSIEATEYFHLKFCKDGFWDSGTNLVDFSNRIIIPVYDDEGELASFQARDITGLAERKYLFPSGFASTGSIIYNAYNFVDATHAAIGEGVFDVFGLKMALDEEMSLRNVIPLGTFGKHLAKEQINVLLKLKRKGLKTITFMWDSEVDAMKAAIKAGLVLTRHGFQVKIATLPPGEDPSSASREEVLRAFYGATLLTPTSAVRMLL